MDTVTCPESKVARFIEENRVPLQIRSDNAPEAVFPGGVCGYKQSHDPKPLKAACERLKTDFPGSEWANRAYPYRLL